MSKHTAHAHIAGEVVASGSRPANEVATRIIERLAADGYRIVPANEVGAMKALILLNAAFDLSGAGIEGLSEILASVPPIPENLAA